MSFMSVYLRLNNLYIGLTGIILVILSKQNSKMASKMEVKIIFIRVEYASIVLLTHQNIGVYTKNIGLRRIPDELFMV